MILYVLDLLGVAVFAVSGTLAAIAARLDLLGIFILASVTAIGGGTLRDVLLSRHPIFWIRDTRPIWVIAAAMLLTIGWVRFLPVPMNALLIVDAMGLGLFAILGAQVAETAGCHRPVIVLMGTLTGVGGGVIRDLLSAKVPLILRQDIYATAAIVGIAVYLLLRAVRVPTLAAFVIGFITVVALRLAAITFGLHLPVIAVPK